MGTIVTACFAPSDPEGVAIGMRVDDGVLTLYIPLCPGETVKSAEVDLPQGNGKRVLTAEDPVHPESKVVRLEAANWHRVSGSFHYTGQEFSVNVVSTAQTYGAAAIDQKLPTDLPQGTYDSDDKQVTPSDLDSAQACNKHG